MATATHPANRVTAMSTMSEMSAMTEMANSELPTAQPSQRILVLGGSTEASALIHLMCAHAPNVELVLSFAGRTSIRNPSPPGVDVRVGGFGGIDGLTNHLRTGTYTAMIDATHPFAARMPFNAAAACASVGIPLLRLARDAWAPEQGDRWIPAGSVPDAATRVQDSGARRVLLTIGRQELQPFGWCDAEFVVRSIEPPDPTLLPAATVLLARAPFTLDGEIEVLQTHRIDLVVAKNSGGTATRPKLDAARQLAIPVVMVERPPTPPGDTVTTAEAAMTWLVDRIGTR